MLKSIIQITFLIMTIKNIFNLQTLRRPFSDKIIITSLEHFSFLKPHAHAITELHQQK